MVRRTTVNRQMLATGRYTVTAVDLRGHGRSDRASSYTRGELADDVVESLPQGLHSVVGHSLGGAVLVRAVERLRPAPHDSAQADRAGVLRRGVSGWVVGGWKNDRHETVADGARGRRRR